MWGASLQRGSRCLIAACAAAAQVTGAEYGSAIEKQHVTFLELAVQRFESRTGRPATIEEENWHFDNLQLIRVPKAGSSEASVIARRLGGCNPRGPCCAFPGDPAGSCPAKHLMCPAVVGCIDHRVQQTALVEPSLFSMSTSRDVVDRMVSGFFYAHPHSPECAHGEVDDIEGCFMTMVNLPRFQNIASRMFTGHYAYSSKPQLCLERGSGKCGEDLRSVIRGACNVNYIIMREAWNTSVLLLFEVLPWLAPTKEFFPLDNAEESKTDAGVPNEGRENHGKKHEEGIKLVTPVLRDAARAANEVDGELREFVSVKFCRRLRETGLLHDPLVAEELGTYEPLAHRCYDDDWVDATLARFEHLTPRGCRLYQPLSRPDSKV